MKSYLKPIFDRIYTGSVEDYSKLANGWLENNEKKFIITANPEILMKAENNEDLREMLLDESTSVIPDGVSVVKAMQKNDYPAKERITGVDLIENLLEAAGSLGKSVYLLGAKEEIVSLFASKLEKEYPSMTVNYHNGYDGDKDEIFEEIKALKPDIIAVALGVPAQERLIAKHLDSFDKGIFVGVGGSFDVLSGSKRRAPKFFIKTNTEWLYRIVREPSRLGRFYRSNVKFMKYIK